MNFLLYLHILSATAWIGGSIFMAILGISLKDKQDQDEVYPRIGGIFGYFEIGAFVALVLSGVMIMSQKGLWSLLSFSHNDILTQALWIKLFLVFLIFCATALHSFISFIKKPHERTRLEQQLTRASSVLILLLSLLVLHYAMILRDVL
ncbi:MAG: hypothetical protein IE878_01340 [Epsilonproteobacteria bacterium]|nr:hypothetical protein [Campylobacterota bacterium]MBD3839016.1 hypothetical protein [Campylobacterota bacterium]